MGKMSSDGGESFDMVLQPASKTVKPQGEPREANTQEVTQDYPQAYPKTFCANAPNARALLRDLILWIGASKEIIDGKATDEQIKILAQRLQDFLIILGDTLMIDAGLTAKDIEIVSKELKELKTSSKNEF
jgi:hypothetical protein